MFEHILLYFEQIDFKFFFGCVYIIRKTKTTLSLLFLQNMKKKTYLQKKKKNTNDNELFIEEEDTHMYNTQAKKFV